MDAFGGIDIVYANAGGVRFGAAVRFGAIDSRPYEDFAFTMRAELDSVWLTVRTARPHLLRSRGCVLTVGWTAGLTGSLTNRRTAHSASKGAVIALTRQLAAEGAPHGVRVNCVSPGMIDTGGLTRELARRHARDERHLRSHPARPAGSPHRRRQRGRLPGLGRGRIHHRRNLVVDGGWSTVLPGAAS